MKEMTEQARMSESSEKISFETALEQLQVVIKRLEGGDLSLDQALEQFETGVRLTRACQEQLAVAEQRVELLMKASPGAAPETKPFNPQRG